MAIENNPLILIGLGVVTGSLIHLLILREKKRQCSKCKLKVFHLDFPQD